MYQKDFLLFVIEQFARLLRKILARILERDYDQAEFLIEQVYRQYLGINSDLINRLSYRYLMKMQRTDPGQYQDRLVVLFELLALEARVFRERGVLKDSFQRYLKTLNILLALFLEEEVEEKFREKGEKVPELTRALEEIQTEAAKPENALNPEEFFIPEQTRVMLRDFNARNDGR